MNDCPSVEPALRVPCVKGEGHVGSHGALVGGTWIHWLKGARGA